MLGSLFVRSIDTAEHINIAMQARGFDGKWKTATKLRIHPADYVFASAAMLFIFGLYFFGKPVLQ